MPPPPLVPEIHRSVPFVLTALRGLPPLIASVSAVVASRTPAASTRAITRLIDADVDVVMLAVPTAASYPVATRNRPSADRVSNPSDVAVPLAVSRWFAPATVVGSGIDWTNTPDVVYSSRNTGVAVEASAPVPSPTR